MGFPNLLLTVVSMPFYPDPTQEQSRYAISELFAISGEKR